MINVREVFAVAFIKAAKAISPAVWEKEVTDAASHVSVVTTMNYLDKMGYDHCANCAQTNGLYNIAGRAYCHRHMPKLDATVWAIN